MDDNLKRSEEQKREKMWDPAQRWRVLQETITWAESLPSVARNTLERCLELQKAKLAALRSPSAQHAPERRNVEK
jgi:hypothetical protein